MERALLESDNSLDRQRDGHRELVERIAKSQCFRNSARMREFLLYVSDCALRDAAVEATEQQIGIHIFGRMAGYNSSEDSIVRTHARLLRQKLTEYFADEGIDEAIILEIPKGHYLPLFHERKVTFRQPIKATQHAPEANGPSEPPARDQHKTFISWKFIAGLGILALFLAATVRWWRTKAIVKSPVNTSTVEEFWKPFMTNNSSLVIYSNAMFTGNSMKGLKYASLQDSETNLKAGLLIDTYTGVGELSGVYELTKLFDQHGASFTLKRGQLVTWDEAKLKNLIFIGSVAENPPLRDVTSTTDFTMTRGNGLSGVVNHHPQSGELPVYSVPLYSPTKDYAILAYLPGLQPDKHMLIFSGLTTMGTQAAVDFTCHPDTLQELMRKANDRNGEIRPFEAILETKIVGGVPLETRLVALHIR